MVEYFELELDQRIGTETETASKQGAVLCAPINLMNEREVL